MEFVVMMFVLGPIPARAGEPPRGHGQWHAKRAYPRSRGGTLVLSSTRRMNSGLSPLAWGNRQAVLEAN